MISGIFQVFDAIRKVLLSMETLMIYQENFAFFWKISKFALFETVCHVTSVQNKLLCCLTYTN